MFNLKKRKPKEAIPAPEPKVEEQPVEKYTEDGCKINKFGYRMLMAYPKDINYNNIPVSTKDFHSVYRKFFEKGMVSCWDNYTGDQISDYRFHILAIQNLMNYASSATVKLEYLKKQAVERGIAHYDSSGQFQLSGKNPVDIPK